MARLSGNSDIFKLIKSLSSEEKGYFIKYAKRHSEGGNEKLLLFQAIDKQSSFDDAALKKQFKNLAVVKHLLFEELLQALYIGKGKGSPLQAIDKHIAYIIILFSRGLQQRALSMAKQTLADAMENELLERAIVLQSLIEDMTINTLAQHERWEKIHDFHTQNNQLIQALSSIKKLFFEERKIIYIENLDNPQEAQKLLKEIDIHFLESYKTFHTDKERVSLYTSLTFYYKLKGDYKNMYRTSSDGIAFNKKRYEQHQGKVMALNYMVAIFNHQHVCLQAGDLDGAEREFKSLQNLNTTNKHLDNVVIRLHEVLISQHIFFWRNSFREGFEYATHLLKNDEFKQNALLHHDSYCSFLGNAALFALLTNKYKEAYTILQQMRAINTEIADPKIDNEALWLEAMLHQQANDSISFTKQLELIEAFEKKNKSKPAYSSLIKQIVSGSKKPILEPNFMLLEKLKFTDWLAALQKNCPLAQVVAPSNTTVINQRRKMAGLK